MVVKPTVSIQKQASVLGKEEELIKFLEIYKNIPLENLIAKFLAAAKVNPAAAKLRVLVNHTFKLNSGSELFTINYNPSKKLHIFLYHKNVEVFETHRGEYNKELFSYFDMMLNEGFGNKSISFDDNLELLSNYATMLCVAIAGMPKGSIQYVIEWNKGDVAYYNALGNAISKQNDLLSPVIDEGRLAKDDIGNTPKAFAKLNFPYKKVKFGVRFKVWLLSFIYSFDPKKIVKKIYYKLK